MMVENKKGTLKKKNSTWLVFGILFLIVNVIGLGLGGLLAVGQVSLSRSLKEERENEKQQAELIEEMKNSGKYNVYDAYSYEAEPEWQAEVTRIVEENALNEYVVVYDNSKCVIVDMSSVSYRSKVQAGENYILTEKEPIYQEEQSKIAVVRCVAQSEGFLGHPGPGEILLGFFAGTILFITIFVDFVLFFVFLIVGLKKK